MAGAVIKLVDGKILRAQIGDDLIDMVWSPGLDHGINFCQFRRHVIEQALVVNLDNITAATPDRDIAGQLPHT